MKKFIRVAFSAAAICALVAATPRANAQRTDRRQAGVLAVSDGRGNISLLWFPQPDRWPAGGWRIEDASGKVLAPHVAAGDPDALKALPDSEAQAIRNLPRTLASPAATGRRREQLFGILAINALGNPAYARALGLAWTLQSVPAGPRSYRVVGLDNSGRPTGLALSSAILDSSAATPLPAAPENLSAESGRNGVSLLWSPSLGTPDAPVIAYDIVRDSSGAKGVEVTPKPLILGTKWNAKAPAFVDQGAPPEQLLAYHVMCVDVFGRRGAAADVKIFYPDTAALDPPEPVTADATPEGVLVAWKPGADPHTAGYVIERAFLYDGPYEALTPQAVAHDTAQYVDSDVRGGTAYYYRVRAVGPRGDLGPPSHSVMVQPRNASAPPKPQHVKAELGATRVRVTWSAVAFPVAGYFVERLGGNSSGSGARSAGGRADSAGWVRLNARPTPEPLLDDYFGGASGTRLSYRVVAVAYDNQESAPSDSVSVALPDNSLPGAPVITSAKGGDGKAIITFVPGAPAEKTAQFLVLRGGSDRDLGVVIGDPLPGSARDFVDRYVTPGNEYSYRLIAVDQNGNRSDPTNAVIVRVGAPAVPAPAAPIVQFANDPFPQVRIEFAAAPAGMGAMIQIREGENGRWKALAGPVEGQNAVMDANPPAKDPVFYRVLYRAADGALGAPSDAAQLRR